MIKTPFDALQPKPLGQKALQAVEVVDARWKHIRNRNEAHQAFMDTIPHRPLTINDFRRWLKEFYCEHYLPKRKNGAAKAEDLRQLLCALDQAEALGAEFGTDLSKFLACKPSGINSIAHALQSKRRKKSRDQSWGWTTVCNTFLKPELVTLTRDNRDQFHRDFMKAVQNDVPTLTDFLQWLKEFYCEHYLPTQKHGEKKRDAIEAMLNAIPLPKKDDSGAKLLSIAEFLEQHPGLQTQIQSKRMGISKKESWGWKQIEESFLEPERLAKQPQYGLG